MSFRHGASDAEQVSSYLALVDSDPESRARLAALLSPNADVVADSITELETRLPIGGVSVVVFGPSFANPNGLAAIQAFGQGRADVGSILVTRRLVTKLLKAALRAGVRDVLVEPVDSAELDEAITSVSRILNVAWTAPVRPTEPGRVVTVFSPKGGVGTSVLAANLATSLARRSVGPVALIDAHIEFGDAAVLFNIAPHHTIMDAVAAAHESDTDVVQRLLTRHEPSGVYVLPAPIDPAQVDNISAHDVLAVVAALKEVCSYVVIDTPSTFNDVVLGVFEVSDEVVFVGGDDVPAVKNVKVGLQALSQLNLTAPRVSLVLNRVQGNGHMHSGEVERALGVKVDLAVPADAVVVESVKRGNPFVLDAPKSKASRAIEALTVRISTPRPHTDADLLRST